MDGLVRGRRELDALEAQWLFMAGEYARSGECQADGFLTAAAAIQKRFRMDAGDISRAHAAVIAAAYTDERALQLAAIEDGSDLENLKLLCWAHHRKHHLETAKKRE